jgi:hypothetical protein
MASNESQRLTGCSRSKQVNHYPAGLSEQQRDVLDVIARLKPGGVEAHGDYYGRWGRAPSGSAGYYFTDSVVVELAQAGDRSASASLARTLARLEQRGLIRRHGYQEQKKNSCYRFFTLTEAGLVLVNEIRQRASLPALTVQNYPEEPPVSMEALQARLRADWKALDAKINLSQATDAAARLDADGLVQLRQWIDARLAEQPTVNKIFAQ